MSPSADKDQAYSAPEQLSEGLKRDLERAATLNGPELVAALTEALTEEVTGLASDIDPNGTAEALRTGLCLIRDLTEDQCRVAFRHLRAWDRPALKAWWLRAVFELPALGGELGRTVAACLETRGRAGDRVGRRVGRRAALELVKKAPALLRPMDRGQAVKLLRLTAVLARRDAEQALEAFLAAPELLRPLPDRARSSVLNKARDLARSGQGEAAVNLVHRALIVFSQAGLRGLGRWYRAGLAVRAQARAAFFDLASPAGRRALDRAAGGLSLERAAQTLRLYAAALTDRRLELAPSLETGRLGLVSALAAGWLDGRTVRLPVRQQGQRALDIYRARLALVLTAPEAGYDFLLSFEDPPLAADAWALVSEHQAAQALLESRPGLAGPLADLNRFRRAAWAQGPGRELRHPAWRLVVLRLWGGLPRSNDPESRDLAARALAEIKTAGRPLEEVVRRVYGLLSGPRGRARPQMVEEVEAPKLKFGSLDPRLFESDIGLDPALSQKAQAVNLMSRDSGRAQFLASLSRLSDQHRGLTEDPAEGQVFLYPEWDRSLSDYRPGWVQVVESAARPVDATGSPLAGAGLPPGLVRQVRRRFQRLRPRGLKRSLRRLEGQEIDLSAAVESLVDQARGVSGSDDDRVYEDRRLSRRSVAAALLIDLSGSTGRRIGPETGPRVVDVARDGLWLFAEALAGLGDDFALYGFSGQGREAVRFSIIKDFDQPWNLAAARRLDGLEPGRQNRDGAALRHAAAKLAAHPARRKALIYVSDGRPDDYEYSCSYAVADTRLALAEINRSGIKPFCLTIDTQARSYIKDMMGPAGYCIIDDVRRLPAFLPLLYRRLAG